MIKKLFGIGLAATVASLPIHALAYDKGNMLVRFGSTTVDASDKGEPDNIYAANDTQLGVTGVYFLADNLGLELLASSPFEHDVRLKGVGTVASTKQLPPTLSLQYYFSNSSVVTPYLGLGLNYTIFFNENLKAANHKGIVNTTNLELKNSSGLALQVGADIAIDEKWGVNLDIRKIDIETEVETGPLAGAEVEIDPMVYSFTITYSFN